METNDSELSNIRQLRPVSTNDAINFAGEDEEGTLEVVIAGVSNADYLVNVPDNLNPLSENFKVQSIEEVESERLARREGPTDTAQRLFTDYAPAAAQVIVHTAIYSKNERVKLQAAQHILDRAMGRVQDNPPTPPNDPYQMLMAACMRELTAEERAKYGILDTE